MQIRAFAKINLVLEVVGKRPDGYHEIKSVMQSLALHDMIKISVAAPNPAQRFCETSFEDNFKLVCNDPRLPTDERNLVTRAAKYMMQKFGITRQVSIWLKKRIPVAAGLAGGSSDCAAAILGLNKLFGLNIPLHSTTQTDLLEIGQMFGADVPFCLMANAAEAGVTALAEGIGEKLTPLPSHPHVWIVLACPKIYVSTANVFGKYNAPVYIPTLTATAFNYPAVRQALTKSDLNAITANFKNDLTQVTAKLHPKIQDIINEMNNQGAIGAAMSGSGPSVFGYFSNKETAEKARYKLHTATGRTFLTKII